MAIPDILEPTESASRGCFQRSVLPLVEFSDCSLHEANTLLAAWGHKMGELKRGNQGAWCHVLLANGEPQAVTTASNLIAANVGGGLKQLTRENTVELSRLCAVRPGLCRVALRLWREFVWPTLGYEYAISYQDADLHTGNTYRFDGWERVGQPARSGTDTRSGRPGRTKWVWLWPPQKRQNAELCDVRGARSQQ